jgi:hypothetical protein
MGAQVTAVSSNFGGAASGQAWGADHAFDGQMSTEWSSRGDGDDAFVEIDLGRPRKLTAFALVGRPSMGSFAGLAPEFGNAFTARIVRQLSPTETPRSKSGAAPHQRQRRLPSGPKNSVMCPQLKNASRSSALDGVMSRISGVTSFSVTNGSSFTLVSRSAREMP